MNADRTVLTNANCVRVQLVPPGKAADPGMTEAKVIDRTRRGAEPFPSPIRHRRQVSPHVPLNARDEQ
ncbi:MAG: hypothetical protein F4186_08905 [Boseongicola sp. SB0676_bin_33]|uniref:Uncharacterized protein n=1 Tax=Boseongicola sp. SB0664_bin_43 TaxID=2604844 RepID=A0A6B0Y484_9RHOB|nr:hypothetical protein [Boseongicola sp. SB0664_bin_43]MYF89447.1 hypothetical protein [Boseongicola sp. SB0676_bin_33]MYK32391.1 hypothetical protein [Boseongicola sp. SB0670_bin_30]